jgi:hypothetical protein
MKKNRQIETLAIAFLSSAFFIVNFIPLLGPGLLSLGAGHASHRLKLYQLSGYHLIISLITGETFFFGLIAILALSSSDPITTSHGFLISILIGYGANLAVSLICYLCGWRARWKIITAKN